MISHTNQLLVIFTIANFNFAISTCSLILQHKSTLSDKMMAWQLYSVFLDDIKWNNQHKVSYSLFLANHLKYLKGKSANRCMESGALHIVYKSIG